MKADWNVGMRTDSSDGVRNDLSDWVWTDWNGKATMVMRTD